MKKFKLLPFILTSVVLIACGGDGDSQTPSTQPSTNYQGTYLGAAKVGDMAEFTVNGTKLSYKVEGSVFGSKTGSFDIKPLAIGASSNTHFWKSTDNNIHLFLAENLGFAYISNVDPNGKDSIVIGLREIGDINSIIGKEFIYIDITTFGVASCSVIIKNDKTYNYECSSGDRGDGCWKTDSSNKRLLAKDTINTINCSSWDGSGPDYYITAKSINAGRAGFILDHVDGTGVGIGLEKKIYDLNSEIPADSIQFETLDWTMDNNGNLVFCTTTVDIQKNQSGNWTYTWKSGEPCNYTAEGIIQENCYYDNNGTEYQRDGILCASDTTTGTKYNIMIDREGGYYIAIPANGNDIELGAIK